MSRGVSRKVIPIAAEMPDEIMISLYEAQKKDLSA